MAPSHPAPPERPEVPDGIVPTAPAGRTPAWRPMSAFGALFAALAAATVLGGVILAAAGGGDHTPPGASIAATFIQDLVFVGAALAFAAVVTRPRPWQFGLRRPRSPGGALLWVALGYGFFLAFTAVWLTALGATDTQDNLTEDLGVDSSTAALVAVAILVSVMAPLCEEFLFRGYIFGALRNWRGPWPAAAITGLLFGAVHGVSSPVEFLLPLAVLGALLCVIYQRTGSLYPCMALHCLNNSLAFGTSQHWGGGTVLLLLGALAAIATVLWLVARFGGRAPALPTPAWTRGA